jgi:osmotically-inducible protein OsmY
MRQSPKTISDEDIRAAVVQALTAQDAPSISELHVGVLNGVVHLAGKVETVVVRAAIERIASQVAGVRGVVNRIDAPGAPSPARTIHLDLNGL